jgi:hypothetical protein
MKTILRNTIGKARFLGPVVVAVVALVLISNIAYAGSTSNLRIIQKTEPMRFQCLS